MHEMSGKEYFSLIFTVHEPSSIMNRQAFIDFHTKKVTLLYDF
jgi:hypothetical protein